MRAGALLRGPRRRLGCQSFSDVTRNTGQEKNASGGREGVFSSLKGGRGVPFSSLRGAHPLPVVGTRFSLINASATVPAPPQACEVRLHTSVARLRSTSVARRGSGGRVRASVHPPDPSLHTHSPRAHTNGNGGGRVLQSRPRLRRRELRHVQPARVREPPAGDRAQRAGRRRRAACPAPVARPAAPGPSHHSQPSVDFAVGAHPA
jgi:hypothetical protein